MAWGNNYNNGYDNGYSRSGYGYQSGYSGGYNSGYGGQEGGPLKRFFARKRMQKMQRTAQKDSIKNQRYAYKLQLKEKKRREKLEGKSGAGPVSFAAMKGIVNLFQQGTLDHAHNDSSPCESGNDGVGADNIVSNEPIRVDVCELDLAFKKGQYVEANYVKGEEHND